MADQQPQWGREGRRIRRERAREWAKEAIQVHLGNEKQDRWSKALAFIGVAAGFGSWGYFVLAPDPNLYFGSALLLICLVFLASAFWVQVEWGIRVKGAILIFGVAILGTLGYRWVSYVGRPSFVFVSPGVVLNGNSWDFFINHRGPRGSESVQILFVDKDKRQKVLNRNSPTLSREDINSYQQLLQFPEVNPRNRGDIFGKQFIWIPPVIDHEHYEIEITAKDRVAHQELQIERVNGEWVWATQITDRESGKRLLGCSDTHFPYGDKAAIKCFPEFSQPSD
jgi:hypothetical protein